MKRSRFSENRIIGILKEHPARMSALDLCRKHGISEATFYKYKAKFGGIARRDAVAHLCAVHGVSQRRACDVLAVDRSSVRYRSVRPDDAAVRDAMKEVAAERRRFGYRRIHVMLQRQGIAMNLKKLRRLYREERLQVRKRGGRKRALGTRRSMLVPEQANERWSLDFLSDAFTDSRRFRILAVVDDHTR